MESSGSSPVKSSLPMVYYALIVVGAASIVLALYNLVALRWCSNRRSGQNPFTETVVVAAAGTSGGARVGVAAPASFRFKKEMSTGDDDRDCECSVCLSAFEEGEEIRRLPRCRHVFHAPCIDMWLFSHSDCPLCRAPVGSTQRHVAAAEYSV